MGVAGAVSTRTLHAVLLLAVSLGAAEPAFAVCQSKKCPPSEALEAVGQMIAEECVCNPDDKSTRKPYAKCVTNVTKKAKQDGTLSGPCAAAAKKCALASTCGKPGKVVCCQRKNNGTEKAGISPSETKCEKKGVACPAFTHAFDGCDGSGMCATTTSTSTSSTTSTSVTTTSTPSSVTTTSNSSVTSTVTSTSTTTTFGTIPDTCFDGSVQAPEECDDGNRIDFDGCTNACTICGNGSVFGAFPPFEECDDGNLVPDDGCDPNCRATGCGNGFKSPEAESCDDGNNDDDDDCPADCVIDSCNANAGSDFTATVSFASPGNQLVGAMDIVVEYPEAKVVIPGVGEVGDRIGMLAAGSYTQNDREHNLKTVFLAGSLFGATPGQLERIHFETCAGQTAPTVGEFRCKVLSASTPALPDPGGQPLAGVTCSVALP
jgi:cysteine-rich repeat protein